MKHLYLTLTLGALFMFSSCEILMQTANTVLEQNKPLTAAEVAQGLKEALKVGTDSAVVRLSRTNGYYLNQALKINLPPETDQVIKYAQKIPGMQKLIDDLVLQINRSAEDAAKQAAPIFKSAITSMSITDAFSILNGSNNAATQYLKDKTYSQLLNLYAPQMQQSLKKPLVGNVSALKTWDEITVNWNKFANSVAGKVLEAKPVNTKLDQYITEKALNGLFVKVADQETQIRTNVTARVNDLLKRVFGGK